MSSARHPLALSTLIADTTAWLRQHGATWKPGPLHTTDIVIQQPEHPDQTAHLGDTLTWDGERVIVEGAS